MVGSITGRKGELIKKMCEEIRARIRVVDAPVGTPDCVRGGLTPSLTPLARSSASPWASATSLEQMCPNCLEDPPGGCSKTVSVIEEKRNPNGLCSSSVLKSAKESSLCTVSGTCVPIFVYQRKNGPGISENIGFDKTSVVLRRIGDCDSTVCSNSPSIAETEASGAPIMPSLGLDYVPTCANSQDRAGGSGKTVSVTKEKRNPNGLCSSCVLKSTKESCLNTVAETCVPISVYKRKNGPGGSENIGFDNTSVFLTRIGGCGSTICSTAPSIAETEASGASIMPSLELDTKPTCANSQDPASGCSKTFSVAEEKRNSRGLSSLSVLKSTKESSLNRVSETCVPIFVYKRKNRQVGSESIGFDMTSVLLRRIGDCDSIICSAAPSIAENVASGASTMPSSESDGKPICGYSREHLPNEKPIEAPKIIDMDSVNESCSSRSNAEPVSVPLKTRIEESGECSSSSVIAIEAQEDSPLSERDICISIIQSRSLLQKEKLPSSSSFEDGNEISTNNSYRGGSRKCKACCRSESAKKMLICDSCDEAFHLSCCNSRVRSFRDDDDEWLCTSCLTKRHILVRQTGNMMRATRIGYEVDRSMLAPAAEKSSPISLMLRDNGPYQTSVRFGKGFQADVPDWTGPVKGDDMFGEPEELDTTVHNNLHVCNSSKSRKLSSIGNWLQCKQVIDNGGETICGKWRRAPLFEVQTDDWECFCSVFWDPSHADCAVPQELDTDQVLKQLKYIEMLRPQLAAKRRKLVRPQLNRSQQLSGSRKNTKKMKSLYKCKKVVL